MTSACALDGQLPNPKNMTKGELGNRIAVMVGAILEGINKRHPHSMDELLHKKELGNSNTLTIAITNNVPTPHQVTKPETAAFELLRASLGFIFRERYGWTDEAVDGMTMPEVFIALEHAMQCDAPSKKSVWTL